MSPMYSPPIKIRSKKPTNISSLAVQKLSQTSSPHSLPYLASHSQCDMSMDRLSNESDSVQQPFQSLPCNRKDPYNNVTSQWRGHSKMLYKERSNKEIRKNFFRNRVVNRWNNLPPKVVDAPSVKSLETRLDQFWHRFGIKYYFETCLEFEKNTRTGLNVRGTDLD